MPSIVQINVSQVIAATPSTLQASGAIISSGGTTLTSGTSTLLTQASGLTSLLAAPLALSSLNWSGGTVIATTAAAIPGRSTGDTFKTTIAGATPAGFNGLVVATVTGANTFTYPLTVNPGNETVAGTYAPPGQMGLVASVNSFFGQGSAQAVSILELGPSDGSTGPPLLQTFIAANPGTFYSYLVPGAWDATTAFLSLLALYEAPNAKTYFFVNSTVNTYTAYAGIKDVVWFIQSPNAPLTEDSIATAYQHSLQYAPSSANRITPFAFSFLFGVTPYPLPGNQALLQAIDAAGGNWVGTGAEGGISNTILEGGSTGDNNDFTYWYAADWIQINAQQALANAVINGSNNPLSPLYYNQQGINFLQDVVVQQVSNAITFGMATGTVARTQLDTVTFTNNFNEGDYADQDVVNAVPFITYTTQNPGDYKIGRYAGLSVVYIPQVGFKQIIFNLVISQFISP